MDTVNLFHDETSAAANSDQRKRQMHQMPAVPAATTGLITRTSLLQFDRGADIPTVFIESTFNLVACLGIGLLGWGIHRRFMKAAIARDTWTGPIMRGGAGGIRFGTALLAIGLAGSALAPVA